MLPDEPALESLSDIEIKDRIRQLELEIAACEGRVETDADEARRSRRLARGTFLTAAGFFGLTLDPISAVIILVGFFDWMEALRDDARQTNLKAALTWQSAKLKAQLELVEAEVRRRTGNKRI
ncbi:MAG TPA: hypothetical protein VGJ01_18000 [Pseudolabrys sp.]|jgi:hypothetical protein